MLRFPRSRRWLEQLLHTHDTPERTAAAFAMGIFWGFSPFVGLHTVLGLAAAFALRLNRVAVIIGVYVNLPWIMPAYYVLATVAGAFILRAELPPDVASHVRDALSARSWSELRLQGSVLAPLGWSYLVGSAVGASVLAAVSYPLSLRAIVAHRKRLHRAQELADRNAVPRDTGAGY
jgi:uncharacterized protein (DUF2062 family)